MSYQLKTKKESISGRGLREEDEEEATAESTAENRRRQDKQHEN